METHRAALAPLLPGPVTIEGHTDLALAGCKFSGNAQRRKRRALLFHGTLLCSLDLALVTRLLRHPSLEPDYRAGRPHAGFLTNLPLAPAALAAALATAWQAVPGPPPPGLADATAALVRERYGTAAWNRRR
jgi:lipoate-protein ligase A